MADIGQTLNSSTTYQHLVANNPDVSLMPGSPDCRGPPVSLCFPLPFALSLCALTIHVS